MRKQKNIAIIILRKSFNQCLMHKLSQAINSHHQVSNHFLLGQQLLVQHAHMRHNKIIILNLVQSQVQHILVVCLVWLVLRLHLHLHLFMAHLWWPWLQWQWVHWVVLRVFWGEHQWCNKGQCVSLLHNHNY